MLQIIENADVCGEGHPGVLLMRLALGLPGGWSDGRDPAERIGRKEHEELPDEKILY